MQTSKQAVLLDSSPLITVCKFTVIGRPMIEHLLEVAAVNVTQKVADEVAALTRPEPDAAVARRLIRAGQIVILDAPEEPNIHEFYALQETDCTVIRLGLTLENAITVLDDHDAFLIANHYGLKPMFLLDLLVLLVRHEGLDSQVAQTMVESAERRYSPAFIAHTIARLEEMQHADDNHS